MGCSMLFIEENVYSFYNLPPTWLFSAWEIANATRKLGTLGTSQVPDTNALDVSQYHVREYLATDVLPCAPFLLLPRVPWFLVQRQPFHVSWSGIQDAPQSGAQVGARRTWCVCGGGLWHPPVSQLKCGKKLFVEYCAVLPILQQDKSVHHRRSDLPLGSLQEIWICLQINSLYPHIMLMHTDIPVLPEVSLLQTTLGNPSHFSLNKRHGRKLLERIPTRESLHVFTSDS